MNGDRVLGYGVNNDFVIDTNKVVPLTIPLGGSAVAQQTDNVNLVGNLQPAAEGVATTPGKIESAVLGDNSVEIPDDIGVGDAKVLDPQSVATATATASATPGSIPAGTYAYKVVFFDPNAPTNAQEAPASSAFGNNVTIPPAGNGTIDLANLPTSNNPSVFTMKRIYRVDVNDPNGQYKQVGADIPQSQSTFTDTAAAGTTTLNSNNLDTNSSYNYFYTFVNPSGLETRPSSESSTIAISQSDERIRLENIPQPTDSQFTKIRIYRNSNSSPGTFYQVDEVPVGTTSYIDSKSDTSIVDPTKVLDRNGPKVTNTTHLVDVSTFNGNSYVNPFKPGTLSFTGSKGETVASICQQSNLRSPVRPRWPN